MNICMRVVRGTDLSLYNGVYVYVYIYIRMNTCMYVVGGTVFLQKDRCCTDAVITASVHRLLAECMFVYDDKHAPMLL